MFIKIAIYFILTLVLITNLIIETAHHNGTTSMRRKSNKSYKSGSKNLNSNNNKRQQPVINSKLVSNLNEPEFDAHIFEPTKTYAVNMSVMLGQNVVLPCAVRNIGSFKILWLRVKDGDVLAYDDMIITQDSRFSLNRKNLNESNLRIQSVKSTDSGEYACQINTQSLKAKLVNLIIMTPPYFIDSDTNVKDESLMQFYTNSFTTGGGGTSNYIINKHANHLHHNHHYNHNSKNKYIEKTFQHLPSTKSVNIIEGEQINLECNAFAIPKPEINWYVKKYQSSVLTEYLLNSSKLTVNNVTRNQYEYFECEATNKIPPSVSKKFKINVNYPPEITNPSSKTYLNTINNLQATQVKFNCSVDSYPESDITWIFMNNDLLAAATSLNKKISKRHRKGIILNKRQSKEKYNIITQSINETFKISSLIINIESDNDFGVYNCLANNSMGNKTVNFYVYGNQMINSLELTTATTTLNQAVSAVQNQNLNKKELIIDDNVYLFSTTPPSTSSTLLNELKYSKKTYSNLFKPSNFSSSSSSSSNNNNYYFNSCSSHFKFSYLILFGIFLINMTI